jgi:hypothetical protein
MDCFHSSFLNFWRFKASLILKKYLLRSLFFVVSEAWLPCKLYLGFSPNIVSICCGYDWWLGKSPVIPHWTTNDFMLESFVVFMFLQTSNFQIDVYFCFLTPNFRRAVYFVLLTIFYERNVYFSFEFYLLVVPDPSSSSSSSSSA